MPRVGHTRKLEVVVQVENLGTHQADRVVELMRRDTKVDSESVTLKPDDRTTLTFTDDYTESDIGRKFDYTVKTGDRNSKTIVFIVGLLVVDSDSSPSPQVVPSYKVDRIEWHEQSKLELSQGDELHLENTT